MCRAVLTSVLEAVAKTPDNVYAEVPLLLLAKRLVQKRVVRRFVLGDGLDDRDEVAAEVAEDAFHLRRPHARLVLVEQGVVALFVVAERLGLLKGEVDELFQVRREGGEGVRLARRLPRLFPERHRLCHLRDERGGHFGRLVIVSLRHPDEAARIRVDVCFGHLRREGFEQTADVVRREKLVGEPAQRGDLVGACFGGPVRHVGFLIPLQHVRRRVEVGHASKKGP